MKHPILYLILILSILSCSCSGISMLGSGDISNLYGEEFMTEIEAVKAKYSQGRATEALEELQRMDEEKLLPSEKALRRNLIGVILFSQGKTEQAILNFDIALTNSRLDRPLTAQVYLNLASSYFRLEMNERASSSLSQADFRLLQPDEAKKFHRLNYQLATILNQPNTQMTSLIWYMFDKNSVNELRDEPLFQELTDRFFALEQRDQLRVINEFDRDELFVVGYLAYLTVERLYFKGEKGEAEGLVRWIERRYEEQSEVAVLLKNFLFRTESFAQMDQFTVGVILPLSGEKQSFGDRVMKGVDLSLQNYTGLINPEEGKKLWPYRLIVKDSEGSPAQGAYRVQELIETHKVSVIIGGLFSDEAIRQYQEAKKYGVLFISLSEVFLPKEEKDHLLLEIPGSVESQFAKLFSPELLEEFGKRAAILYPTTPRGESYVNEFWRRANQSGVQVTGLVSYDPNSTDHRGTVENLLGLKYKRQRQEEHEVLSEMYALEGSRSARRVQVLKPQIDFDWVFLASFPRESLQLIPYFSYYDAINLNIWGGPSWRSQSLANEGQRLGVLNFVGDNLSSEGLEFSNRYKRIYGTNPQLIEMRAFDSFEQAHKLLSRRDYGSREEFNMDVRLTESLKGITGKWFLEDGIWIKEMGTYRMRRGKIAGLLGTKELVAPSEDAEETAVDLEGSTEPQSL